MKKNNIFRIIFMNIKWLLLILIMYILRVFPIKNNRILVISYNGKGYGDNGKTILIQEKWNRILNIFIKEKFNLKVNFLID